MLYEIENLHSAREFLSSLSGTVTLRNPRGSTRYYGMRVVDHMFKTLRAEFPRKISNIVVDVYDDYSAFVTARSLGYTDIMYTNT
ncbi:hypothetical protein OAP56_01885 [Rickettsiaceae bacterium]|nr:hypothetical protein [Rickettsiaceae bacterium]